VRRQAALLTRAEVAMSTLKGLLPSVQPQVRRQAALLCESRVAVLTNVRGHGHSARESEVVNETCRELSVHKALSRGVLAHKVC
jgi:hypothetical protein